MRTIGQIVKEERLKKGFTLVQVEAATKIRTKFLAAIEADDFKTIPASPYIQGFVKNYSDFLGLPTTTIMALLRRQLKEQERQNRALIEEPLTESGWKITPNKVIFTAVVVLVGTLLTYFFSQYRALHASPPLTVESPAADKVTKDETLAVFGKTDHDATLTINKEPVLVKDDGMFYKDIVLTVGTNTLIIEATSRVKEKTTIVRRITRLSN